MRSRPDGFVAMLSTAQMALAAGAGLGAVVVVALLLVWAALRAAWTGTSWRQLAGLGTGAGGAAFIAAALPPLSLVLAVRLVWQGWLPPDLLAVATLLPAALLGVVAWLAARRARAAALPADAPPRRPRVGRVTACVLVVLLALSLVAAAAGVALVPLVALGAEWLTSSGIVTFSHRVAMRFKAIDVGRRYRLPPDPAITLEAAGRAYYRVASAERPWGPFPLPWGNSPESLILRARSGLSAQERAAAEGAFTHPGFHDWAIVARAPALDAFAAHARLPLPRDLIPWQLPSMLFPSIQGAGRVHVAGAALQLSAGRADLAELHLRETVSFGVAMSDHSTTLIEGLIGVAIAGQGLRGLQALYEATGRAGEARALAAAIGGEGWLPDVSLDSLDMEARRVYVVDALADSRAPRALRWELLHHVPMLPCTNVPELLLGPRADVARAVDRARRDLARLPGERAVFEVFEQTIPRMARAVRRERMTSARTASALGRLLGDEIVAGCGSVGLYNLLLTLG
jgi:hypothetical protein